MLLLNVSYKAHTHIHEYTVQQYIASPICYIKIIKIILSSQIAILVIHSYMLVLTYEEKLVFPSLNAL